MHKRVWILSGLLLLIFFGIVVQLYRLATDMPLAVTVQQSSKRFTVATARGTIYDRYLEPLINREERLVAAVAPFADVSALGLSQASTLLEELQSGTPAIIELQEWLAPTVGLTQVSVPCRYDAASPARHLIGYLNGEGDGVTGIEAGYEELLSAYEGEASVTYQIDALGNVVEGEGVSLHNTLSDAKGGIGLTLDTAVQNIAEEAAENGLTRGAVVISAVGSGDILAYVSLPTFDQNEVEASLEDLSSPLLDRVLTNYNCGSVFKIVTAAAALESGIPAERTYVCSGSYQIGSNTFHCHNPLGDGRQTMTQAMANSCNCYFLQLALEVGAKPIRDMAQKMGFGEVLYAADGIKTARSLLPSEAALSVSAALGNLCIGQGELMASPLHINALCAAVANGGIWYEPRVFMGEVTESKTLLPAEQASGKRVFSKTTAEALGKMLCAVVEKGTGTAAAPAYGAAAGKTGTAETGWEQDGEEVVQSWFCGYYPAEEPQYVITVLSENGGNNGQTAAPVFAAICDALLSKGLVENTQDFY